MMKKDEIIKMIDERRERCKARLCDTPHQILDGRADMAWSLRVFITEDCNSLEEDLELFEYDYMRRLSKFASTEQTNKWKNRLIGMYAEAYDLFCAIKEG